MEAAVILAIIESVLKYGPSAIRAIYELMESAGDANITPAMIRNLKIDKEPEDYFSG